MSYYTFNGSITPVFFYQVLSPNNEDNEDHRIRLVLLEIVVTPNLHLQPIIVSLSLSPTLLLCSMIAFCRIFVGLHLFLVHLTLKS